MRPEKQEPKDREREVCGQRHSEWEDSEKICRHRTRAERDLEDDGEETPQSRMSCTLSDSRE